MTREDMDDLIARRLYRRRRELGLKLAEVGNAAGLSDKRISKFESGENRVSAAQLYRLAEALRAPVAYFFCPPTAAAPGAGDVQS